MGRRSLLAAAIAAAFALGAPVALAQPGDTNPLSPGLPVTPSPTPTTTATTTATATTTTGTGSLSGGSVAAIAIGALVVLGGISLFIWRDARRRAPTRRRMALATSGEGGRPRQRAKPRKLSPAERKRRKRGRAR